MTKDLTTENRWNKIAKERLLGQTIVAVNYMDEENASGMDWHSRPVMFELSNGTTCCISADDEGNDGGALFMQDKNGKDITLPTLR